MAEDYVPNKFNFDFLDANKTKKITFNAPTVLRFSQSCDAIDQCVIKNKRITYALEGSQLTRLTNESNLHQKIATFNAEVKKQSIIQIDSENKETDSKSEDEDKEKEKKKDDKVRYFSTLDDVSEAMKCRRCGQYGHYQRSCTVSIKESCFYCMGRHHFLDCQQSTCHKCNGQGHKAKDCYHTNSKCYKCDKFGHKETNCTSLILYEDFHNGDFESKDLKRMVCLNCHEIGHINCAPNRKDNLYEDYGERNQEIIRDRIKKHIKDRFTVSVSSESSEEDVVMKNTREWHNRNYQRQRYNNRDYHRDQRKRNTNYDRYDRRDQRQDYERDTRGPRGRRFQQEDFNDQRRNNHREHQLSHSSFQRLSKIQRQFQMFEKQRSREQKRLRRQDNKSFQKGRRQERKQQRLQERQHREPKYISGYQNQRDNRNHSNSKSKFETVPNSSNGGSKKRPTLILL